MSNRPSQPKSTSSSQNSSSSSIGRNGNGNNNQNINSVNFKNNNFLNTTTPTQQQQQQTLRNSNNNNNSSGSSVSGNSSSSSAATRAQPFNANNSNINRTPTTQNNNLTNNNNTTTDFMSFLNGNSTSYPSPSNGTSTSPTPNTNALSRLETIRQYYMQLSNNLRLITQQLQGPELTAARRQALLMEQARANAAMQEFTEKILKPISASKQQQQQAQMNALQQQQQQQQGQGQINAQQQRQSALNTPSSQMMNFPNRPLPPPTNNNMKSNINTGYSQMNIQQQQQQMQQRATNSNVNLYSQSGLGMIRPIMSSGANSNNNSNNNNMRSLPVNYRPSQVPSNPLPIPQVSNLMASPQRTYRPPLTLNVNNANNASHNVNNMTMLNSTSPPQILPGTPQSKATQQVVMNRQNYLMAAQQHQTSVAQQQLLFQQRLSLFTRDNGSNTVGNTAANLLQSDNITKNRMVAPVLALPPVNNSVNQMIQRASLISPQKEKSNSVYTSTLSNVTKYSSFPASYAVGPKLKELAANYKLNLDEEAEYFLLKIADEFIEELARKSFSFASHRLQPTNHLSNNNNNNNATSKKRPSTSSNSTKKKVSIPTTTPTVGEDQPAIEFALIVEDLMLGLDELINYQPAGNGSIENCRPLIKRSKESSNSSSSGADNSTNNTTVTSNHQHRLNMIKKHSSLYQNYF